MTSQVGAPSPPSPEAPSAPIAIGSTDFGHLVPMLKIARRECYSNNPADLSASCRSAVIAMRLILSSSTVTTA